MLIVNVKVIPGSPEIPQEVEVNCSGLDDTKTLELLINDNVIAKFSVPVGGVINQTFPLSTDQVRNALADIGSCSANFSNVVPDGKYFCYIRTGLDDSMGLRYQV